VFSWAGRIFLLEDGASEGKFFSEKPATNISSNIFNNYIFLAFLLGFSSDCGSTAIFKLTTFQRTDILLVYVYLFYIENISVRPFKNSRQGASE
jgi:hypothetical protein